MENSPVNANIQMPDGTYYQVQLQWLPRVGDKIELYSHFDAASGHQARHACEVTRIQHIIHDVVNRADQTKTGHHFVTVFVQLDPGVLS